MRSNFYKLMLIACLMISPILNLQSQPPIKPLNKQMEARQEKTATKSEHSEAKDETEHSHTVTIDALLQGNEHFRNDVRKNQNFDQQREELSKGQKPNYIVVACSDSRVAPEILFDSGLGEVFVVRTAGNVVDSVGLGSIEYAAEHLHSKMLIIMGHTSCGAVTAAMEGETPSPYINSIIKYINPAVKTAKSGKGDKAKLLNIAIEENVKNQIKAIRKSEIIKTLEKEGELSIVGCVYDIKTGEIRMLK